MAAAMESPISFAWKIGKNLRVNGVEIIHEIEAAKNDYKTKNWLDFGK